MGTELQTRPIPDTARPFLSVTVLSYNYGHFLSTCLDSILCQTMIDFELILINDCSTDDTDVIVKPYLRDDRVIYVNHDHNLGFVASLIEGCERSRGRYMTVISADDFVTSDRAFESTRALVEANHDIAFCYSAWHEVDAVGIPHFSRRAGISTSVVSGIDELRRLLRSSSILHSGTWISRIAYDAVGGYDGSLRFAVDCNMWLMLCTVGEVAYIDEVLYAYRAHSTNMSRAKESFWLTTEEMMSGVDRVMTQVSIEQLPDRERQCKAAKKRMLVAIPTVDIFSNDYRRGWHGYWQAARRFPVKTIWQPRTLVLIARTLLGRRGFDAVRRIRPERHSISQTLHHVPADSTVTTRDSTCPKGGTCA